MNESIENITKYFELKCKKCGSTNIDVFVSDQYGDCEKYLGKETEIICMDCRRFYYFD